MAEDERKLSDELEQSQGQLENGLENVKDAVDKARSFHNRFTENDAASQTAESSAGKTAGKGAEASAKAAEKAGEKAAQEAAELTEKVVEESAKIAAEAAKETATTTATVAAGTAVAPGVGTAIAIGLDVIRKTWKGIMAACLCLSLIVFGFFAILPTVIIKAFSFEMAVQLTELSIDFVDNWYGLDEWSETDPAVRRQACEKMVNDFYGGVMKSLSDLSHSQYNIMQFFDDITDDDTWLGKIFNDASNDLYKQAIEFDMAILNESESMDSNTMVMYLIVKELRNSLDDVSGFDGFNTEEMEEAVFKKYRELYCTPQDGSGFTHDEIVSASEYLKFGTNGGDLSVENMPIVVTGEENFLYHNGKLLSNDIREEKNESGETVKKQYIRDNIMYNPFGNKRSSLSASVGSDYELFSQAAYIVSVYSVSTPYSQQSVGDLISKLNGGLADAKEKGEKLVHYDVKPSEVYYGAIVPRLYQPYVYLDGATYKRGTSVMGYYSAPSDPNKRQILGMGPLSSEEKGEAKAIPAKGWFDVDGNGEFDEGELLPMCMQVINTEPADITDNPIYPNSYCVITDDKRYCNIGEDPKAKQTNTPDSELGFYIYGSQYSAYKDQDYSRINWTNDFAGKAKDQENVENALSEELRADYIYRYQFPFTRTSLAYINDQGLKGYQRFVWTNPEIATDSYTYQDLDKMSYILPGGTKAFANGGLFHGYGAYVYMDSKTQKEVADFDLVRTNLSQFELEDWSAHFDMPEGADTPEIRKYYEQKPFLYTAKIRYMYSLDISAIPNYFDYVLKLYNYQPSAKVNQGFTYTDPQGEEHPVEGKYTQAEVAAATMEAYMSLVGVNKEVIAQASPQVGTFRQYEYAEMLSFVRNSKNADGTPASLNQKYLVYIGICAAGHCMYEWAGDQPPGLDFARWQTPARTHDTDNNIEEEYSGLDCSGFMSWIIKTAYNPEFVRFDTESALNIVPQAGYAKITENVRKGKATASSPYGSVYWDPKKLKVGDIAIRRSFNKEGKLGGHATMFIGLTNNGGQLWIEMTRYNSNGTAYNGIRIFNPGDVDSPYSDYGANKNAVYVSFSDLLPQQQISWSVISPCYMMIPTPTEATYNPPPAAGEEQT